MSTTRVHMCLSVRGALSWPASELRRMCKSTTKDDGTRPTPAELREYLLDELAQGHEVVPFGKPCEGFDYKTGCPGHAVDEPGARSSGSGRAP